MNLDELKNYLGTDGEQSTPADPTEGAQGFAPALKAEKNAEQALAKIELDTEQSLKERLNEIHMAQKLGYFLCKCTWPPQIMVLTKSDFVYKCTKCGRVRDL